MSRLQEAMAGVRAHPNSAAAWAALGQALLANGEHEKAKESYQRALRLDASSIEAQQGLAATLLAQRGSRSESPPPAAVRTPLPAEEAAPPPPRPASTPPRMPSAPPKPEGAATVPPASRPVVLRSPPHQPRKPSTLRIGFGLFLLTSLFSLCVCGSAFLVFSLLPG